MSNFHSARYDVVYSASPHLADCAMTPGQQSTKG
jgi:hypothetical protein